MNKLFLGLLIGIFLISFVQADTINLGDFVVTVEQDSCFNIPNSCDNCTAMNLTVTYPNGTIIFSDGEMTSEDGYHYNYSFCNTSEEGRYFITFHYIEDEIYPESDSTWIKVNPSGKILTEGQAIFGGFFLFILLAIGWIFLYMAFNLKESSVRIFFTLASFVFLMGTLIIAFVISYNAGLTSQINSSITSMAYAFGLVFFVLFAYILIKQIQEAIHSFNERKGYEIDI